MLRKDVVEAIATYWAWRARRGPNDASSDGLVRMGLIAHLYGHPGFNAFDLGSATDAQVYRRIAGFLMRTYPATSPVLQGLGCRSDLARLAPFMRGNAEWQTFIQEYNEQCPKECRYDSSPRRNSSSRGIMAPECEAQIRTHTSLESISSWIFGDFPAP